MDGYDMFMGLFAGMFVFWLILMAILLGFVIISCVAHYKMLNMLGYANPIAAWIPIWNMYAIPDLVVGKEESMPVFGMKVPATLFKLYWLVSFGLGFVPVIGTLCSIVLNGICLGVCYGCIYSALDGKEYDDCEVLGLVSGFFGIIAVVKFLMAKPGKNRT